MNGFSQMALSQLGFRFGQNGPHAARTMMLDDLRPLLDHRSSAATRADYLASVVDSNVLGKPTRKARELAWGHLSTLYALDDSNPIFRALKRLWPLNEAAQPMLALAVAIARDPLLRGTQNFVLSLAPGTLVRRETVEELLAATYPERFSPASLKSFAQNISGTWTAAGFLQGRNRKTRVIPQPQPEALTLLLFLGYLEGRTGQRLFTSDWLNLLGCSLDELEPLASVASHRGLLVFMNAGGVKEVRFPTTSHQKKNASGRRLSHVI
jgi:hypothetical protein